MNITFTERALFPDLGIAVKPLPNKTASLFRASDLIRNGLVCLVLGCMLTIPDVGHTQAGLMASANEAFQKYEYATAAKLYFKLVAKDKKDGLSVSRLAYCYKEINDFDQAVKYYQQSISLPGAPPEDWLYFAEMLKSNGKYKEAKEIFRQYQINFSKDVSNKIKGCDSAAYWFAYPRDYLIENMAYLNTAKSDWGAVFNPVTNSLLFVSDSLRNPRKNFFKKAFNETIYGRTANNFQKIYSISANRDDQHANKVHEFDLALNSYDYHTGPLVFNQAYDSVYFTVTYAGSSKPLPKETMSIAPGNKLEVTTRALELYLSVQDAKGKWAEPQPFPYNKPERYSVGHAALSRDGAHLYFVSDMPGGQGGLDIWYCDRLITGNWSLPKNCGAVINTKEDEAFPVFGLDDNLYFASKGHVGMGGYDIFVTSGEKNHWSRPLNMGAPLNSCADDFYFFQKDEANGFFASNRKGGMGSDDIYQFTMSGNRIVPGKITNLILEIKVIDNATKQPIQTAAINVENTDTYDKWDETSAFDGRCTHPADNPAPYAISVTKPGYYSTIVAINTANAVADTMKVVVPLDRDGTDPIAGQPKGQRNPGRVYKLSDPIVSLHEGDRFRLNNIHYDFDKDNIRPDASRILDTLVDILRQYPSMVIELSSHTDSRGTFDYNENLADRRARSAVAYLIGRGIERRRMIAKGYGESLLLNGCGDGVACSEAEHQENRRTEVKVLRF